MIAHFDITAGVTSVFVEADDRGYPIANAHGREWTIELIGRTFPLAAPHTVIGFPNSYQGHMAFVLRNDGYWCGIPNRVMSETQLRDLDTKSTAGELVKEHGWDFDVLAEAVQS